MNKKEVLEKLKKELKLDDDKIKKISGILDSDLLKGKINKDKIIEELVSKVKIDKTTAEKIYKKFMELVGNGIKDKILDIFKK